MKRNFYILIGTMFLFLAHINVLSMFKKPRKQNNYKCSLALQKKVKRKEQQRKKKEFNKTLNNYITKFLQTEKGKLIQFLSDTQESCEVIEVDSCVQDTLVRIYPIIDWYYTVDKKKYKKQIQTAKMTSQLLKSYLEKEIDIF